MTTETQAPAKHECCPENVAKFREWLSTRGGLAIWESIDLSDPGTSWTGPVNGPNGKPSPKPSWKSDNKPARIITDPSEVVVIVPREVKRFHIAVRTGSNGLRIKVTDASTRKIRAACAKFGENSWYEFDYGSQDAVIYVPDRTVPLTQWK